MQSNGPARGFGIDPISLAGNNGNLIKDLGSYVYTDIDENFARVVDLSRLGHNNVEAQ
jgi:hypothetical protein